MRKKLQIDRHVSGLFSSNMYVISEGGHAILVDPFPNSNALGSADLDMILLTHEHYDHISGVEYWRGLANAPVICSAACARGCADSRRNLSRYSREVAAMTAWASDPVSPISEFTCEADETFEDELFLAWRGHEVRMFECPGHSAGSIGILFDERDLFSGDSLLATTPTELRFPGGSVKDWDEVGRPRFKCLDPGVTVHPGHFEAFELANYEYW